MTKKSKLGTLLLLITALVAGTAIGVLVQEYYYPQNATVKASTSLEIYLDDELWTNGTAIDWGTIEPEDIWYSNLTVVNTGNTNTTVYLVIEGLPQGWTETWTANNTFLEPTESVSGDLTLTVAADATAGTYEWNSYLRAVS